MDSDAYDVISVGSATQDVFARTDAETITIRHHERQDKLLAYPLGGKILIDHLDFQIGGGGTNTACTFARQGLRTGFIGKIGRDPAGYAVIKFLKDEGITFLGRVGGQTGYSVILDSQEEDRTILAYKGANSELTKGELQHILPKLATRWLYCSSMLGESYHATLELMRRMKKRRAKIAFNPSSYQAEKGRWTLKEMLSLTDLLVLNKEEAGLLLQKHGPIPEMLAALQETGPRIVVITDGAAGAWLKSDAVLRAEVRRGKPVVETTGAGDAFASGLVAGLARKLSLQQAFRLGMLNAESAVSGYGAKNHLLTRAEADGLLKRDDRPLQPNV